MVAVQLPGGYWHDGVCHRDAELRPLDSADEAALADAAEMLPPAAFAVAVLGRCLPRLGPVAPVDAAAIRGLLVGDGEALLLHLYQLTYGDRLACQATCPNPDCGCRLECDVAASDLLLPPGAAAGSWHETAVTTDGETQMLRFRLPTIGDRERVVALAQRDIEAACDALARSLVASGMTGGVRRLRAVLNERLAALDPQAELRLSLACPNCTRPVTILLDLGRYLLDTIRQRARQLFYDVHRLARAYHWSERDILALSDGRRQLYLDMLAAEAPP